MPSPILTQADLTKRSPYAGIPTPLKEIAALYNTTSALAEVVEVLIRERGVEGDSAVRVSEFERVISGLRFDIDEFHAIIDTHLRESEEAISGIGPTGYNVGTLVIDTYTSTAKPPRSTLGFVQATGLITIEIPGWYELHATLNWTGVQNNLWYGVDVNVNGGGNLVGGMVWTNQWPVSATVNGTFQGFLSQGDVVSLGWNPASALVNPTGGQLTLELLFT